jgi:cytochrome c
MFRPLATTLSAAVFGVSTLLAFSAAPAFAEGDAAAGEQQFRRCAACHQIGDGPARPTGPSLTGVVGRSIASVPDFNYSDEISARSGEVWTEELLAEYILDPATFIGGRSRMPAQRLREEQLADVIAYLGSVTE